MLLLRLRLVMSDDEAPDRERDDNAVVDRGETGAKAWHTSTTTTTRKSSKSARTETDLANDLIIIFEFQE